MTRLQTGYDRQAVRDRVVAERRHALTAPEGKKVADACGTSSASSRAPPQEVSVGAATDPGVPQDAAVFAVPATFVFAPRAEAGKKDVTGAIRIPSGFAGTGEKEWPGRRTWTRHSVPISRRPPAGNPIGITGGAPP